MGPRTDFSLSFMKLSVGWTTHFSWPNAPFPQEAEVLFTGKTLSPTLSQVRVAKPIPLTTQGRKPAQLGLNVSCSKILHTSTKERSQTGNREPRSCWQLSFFLAERGKSVRERALRPFLSEWGHPPPRHQMPSGIWLHVGSHTVDKALLV